MGKEDRGLKLSLRVLFIYVPCTIILSAIFGYIAFILDFHDPIVLTSPIIPIAFLVVGAGELVFEQRSDWKKIQKSELKAKAAKVGDFR